MPRTDAAQQAAIEQNPVGMTILARVDWKDAPVGYYTNAPGNEGAFGETYLSLGEFGSIDEINEDGDGRPTGVSLTLALPNELAGSETMAEEALSTRLRGTLVTMHMRVYNPTGEPANADPILLGVFEMDVPTITQSTEASIISVACENAAADLTRPNGSRYTDADQQGLFPGDRFFEYVAQMDGLVIELANGSRVTSPGGGGGPGGPIDGPAPQLP